MSGVLPIATTIARSDAPPYEMDAMSVVGQRSPARPNHGGGPDGVSTAERMKMIRIAYLMWVHRNRAETSPILARKNTTVGI